MIDWVNAQPIAPVLTCIGDGHDGIWNIISEFKPDNHRREVLDWFHLMENFQKNGEVDKAIAVFADCQLKQAQNFCAYLEKHRHRIINYQYYQAEQICSIGSGAVESTALAN